MIVIGDIHGNAKTLQALLNKIPKEEKEKGIVLAGDLIDRGPKSADVVQFAIDNSDIVKVALGNHEQMMIEEGLREAANFMRNGVVNKLGTLDGQGNRVRSMWLVNGGEEALYSYYTPETRTFDMEMFVEHVEWMKNLPLYLEFKDVKNDNGEHLLVTHSSAAPVWHWNEERRNNNNKQFRANIIWGRPNAIRSIPNIFNVFGHTPIQHGPRLKSCYANIDTGCFYNGEDGYFKLTALQFPEMIVYQQECIDKPVYGESNFGN